MARRDLAFDYPSEIDTMRARARTRERLTSLAMLGIMATTVAVAGALVYASVWLVSAVAGVFGQQQGDEARAQGVPQRLALPEGVEMLLPAALRR